MRPENPGTSTGNQPADHSARVMVVTPTRDSTFGDFSQKSLSYNHLPNFVIFSFSYTRRRQFYKMFHVEHYCISRQPLRRPFFKLVTLFTPGPDSDRILS